MSITWNGGHQDNVRTSHKILNRVKLESQVALRYHVWNWDAPDMRVMQVQKNIVIPLNPREESYQYEDNKFRNTNQSGTVSNFRHDTFGPGVY